MSHFSFCRVVDKRRNIITKKGNAYEKIYQLIDFGDDDNGDLYVPAFNFVRRQKECQP